MCTYSQVKKNMCNPPQGAPYAPKCIEGGSMKLTTLVI